MIRIRQQVVRLAHERSELRRCLVPLLRRTARATSPLPRKVTAWHCGATFAKFDLSFRGSGESNPRPPLGPGIYFVTERNTALGYCRYRALKGDETVTLYEVQIDASGLVGRARGEMGPNGPNGEAIWGRILETYGNWIPGNYRNVSDLREIMAETGLTGVTENLYRWGIEIAVYDLSTVRIVNRIEFEGQRIRDMQRAADPNRGADWTKLLED